MGYSYACAAGDTLRAIEDRFGTKTSNGLPNGGFWECGKENADGAITGTVWKPAPGHPAGYVLKAGSFRIEPDGRIKRFPTLTKAQRDDLVEAGRKIDRERQEMIRRVQSGEKVPGLITITA